MAITEDLGIQGINDIEPLDVEDTAIYRARQTAEDRMVVVKLLDPRQRPLLPKRFDLRNKALGPFAAHPGVVPVHDSGVTASGQAYLIMPYYRIGSLADQLAHGPMPWHRAAELTLRAAETVAAAHELDLVLGDLKPSSIILADASSPLVSVYGMATKRFGGTNSPLYASPEVQRDEQLFPSADVYSLTLTLAALIAGRPPNRGALATEFIDEVRSLAADRLYEVIDHGLAVHQANRYGTCRNLAQALAAAIGGDPIEPLGRSSQPDEPFDLDAFLGPPAQPEGGTNNSTNSNGSGRPAAEQRPGPRSRPRGRGPLSAGDGGSTAATIATAAFDDAAGIIGAATGQQTTDRISEEPEPTASHPAIGANQAATADSATAASGTAGDSSTSNMTIVSQEPEPTASHPAIGANQAATDVAVATDSTDGVVDDGPVSHEPEPTASHPAIGSKPAAPATASSPAEPTTSSAPPTATSDTTDSAPVSEEPEPTASHPAIGSDTVHADQPTVQAPSEPQPTTPSQEAPRRGAPGEPPRPGQPPIPGQPPTPSADTAKPPAIQAGPNQVAPVPQRAPAHTPQRPPGPGQPIPPSQQRPPDQPIPPGQPIPPSQQLPPNRPVGPGPGRPSSDYGQAAFGQGGAGPNDPGQGDHRLAGYDRPGAPLAPRQGVQRQGYDAPMPFRGFERREMYQEAGNPLSRLLDPVLSLISERRSSGSLLAVLSLVLVAAVVGAVVIRDFTGDGTDDGATTSSLPSNSTDSAPSTFPPTNVAPILIEPPQTNSTAPTTSPVTSRGTTTEAEEETSTSEPTTPSSGPSSSGSTPTSGSSTTTGEPTTSGSSSSGTTDPSPSSSRPTTTAGDPEPTLSLPTVRDD